MYLIQRASLERCEPLERIKEVPFKGNAEQSFIDAYSHSVVQVVLPCPSLSFTSCQHGYREWLFPNLQTCSATSLTRGASQQKPLETAT